MLKPCIFILSLILISCSTHNEYVGTYKSVRPTNKMFKKHNKASYINNSVLDLKKDSTFFFKTCGLFINGKWKIKRGNIILNSNDIEYRNDSIKAIRRPDKKRVKEILFLKKYNKTHFITDLKLGETLHCMKKVD